MMKAVKSAYYTSKSEIVDVPIPTIEPNQVLVQVNYSAIDTASWAVLNKEMTGYFIHSRLQPLVIGWHYTGTVVEVGKSVKNLKLNDKVWGHLQYAPNQKQGSCSEYVAVDEEACAITPDRVNEDLVAAASTESLTALQAMRNHGGLSEGKSVLILGAAGGVGSVAVAIAKRLGAHVTAVCRTKDLDRVASLGADRVLDRSKTDWLKDPTKYDVIFDTPCKYSALKCLTKLTPGGAYVVTFPTLSFALAKALSFFTGKKSEFVEVHSNREDLELVGSWLEDGLNGVAIDRVLPIKDLEKALERQKDPAKIGRIVLKVKGCW